MLLIPCGAYREMMVLDYADARYVLIKNLYSQASPNTMKG